jgi:hypothetical protein
VKGNADRGRRQRYAEQATEVAGLLVRTARTVISILTMSRMMVCGSVLRQRIQGVDMVQHREQHLLEGEHKGGEENREPTLARGVPPPHCQICLGHPRTPAALCPAAPIKAQERRRI